jgi:hypothetical protein
LREELRRLLAHAQRRYRFRALIEAAMIGCAVAGLLAVLAVSHPALMGAIAFVLGAAYNWRAWTLCRTARAIERRAIALDNLVVTAEEALRGRPVHPVIAEELFQQAAERLQRVRTVAPPSLGPRMAIAAAMLAATTSLIERKDVVSPLVSEGNRPQDTRAPVGGTDMVRVYVTPPSYSGRKPATFDNPVEFSVLEGTRVRVDVGAVTQMDFVAASSQVLLVKVGADERLLHLQVIPDRPASVTIDRPGRDLLFAEPRGSVALSIAAKDDIGIASLNLRYTRIAGSGEAFTFEEGDLPVQVSPSADRTKRRGTSTIVLDDLKLEVGDTLVYRALARDEKPGADPATSESFLIEIGKRGEASAGGFAVPDDRDRQALSQQMVIVKTERLQAQRDRLAPDAFLEQSRLLAVEQRMVRAEFLFLTGGEVVDEVEEAEKGHELAAGRLENEGQIELLNAIREMSRAEARLNAADTPQALVFERAALQALQRAFDRRRYFLRTLPERARIDPARRLSGDLSSARPAVRSAPVRRSNPRVETIRQTLLDLAGAVEKQSGLDARLAARIGALDPESQPLREALIRIASAPTANEKIDAARSAQRLLVILLRTDLATPGTGAVHSDPIAGALGLQLSHHARQP